MKLFGFMLVFSLLFVSTTGLETEQEEDPELTFCFHLCKHQGYDESEELECRERCREYIKEKHHGGGGGLVGNEKEDDENPYVFQEKHFSPVIKSDHGEIQLLQKFNHPLLKGIENFRLSVLVANPRAFFFPAHWDAESVVFVAHGTT